VDYEEFIHGLTSSAALYKQNVLSILGFSANANANMRITLY
jgi:hypothetical protein